MRTALSTLGLIAAVVLVGACFDPTRPCSTNADCVNGGTCDPGTKTCVSGNNPNDNTPPVFSIVVAPPSARKNTGKLTELDPGSPDGGVDAFRRDESVLVTVTSTDRDVDAGSVKLVVFGVSGNPGTALELQLVACAPGNQSTSNSFCRQATVALGVLPFDAFRGVVALEASGSDLSSNLGRADAGVNVTRWKWRYSAGAPIYTTPAIADDGTIVFGTSDGGSGSLYALTPAGEEKWAPVQLGPIKASPVLGTADGGQQFAFVGTAAAAGRLVAVEVGDGTMTAACPLVASGYGGPFLGSPALVAESGFEGVIGLANGERVVNIRPGAPIPDDRCISSGATSSQAFPSSVVALGSSAYLGTADGTIRAFTFLSGNWVTNTAWGGGLGYSPVGNGPVQLALVGPSVLGTASPRGFFSLESSSGALQRSFPDAGVQADPGGPIVAGGAFVFGDGRNPAPSLYSASGLGGPDGRIPLADPLVGTPVVGSGGHLYLATFGGFLESRVGPSDLRWSSSLGTGESFLASPTIGCGTQGASGSPTSTGVLYVGSTAGNLFAIAVDSAGLDSTAPWPKYQHDLRNTGSPTTRIQSCP